MTAPDTMPTQAPLNTARQLFPGFAVSVVVAATAQFISEHYGAPAMLMALLLGIALSFLTDDGTRTAPGIAFTGRTVLRFGVALLGVRISADLLGELGADMIFMVVGAVVATILFSLAIGRLTGIGWRFALLTGGSVAICGASAAMAINAVLPQRDTGERDLIFTVLGVTVLSTIAMVIYPMITTWLELDARAGGVFLGGTIHDVAQVVGAGFSISNDTGEAATLVKLIRVAMLAPVVLAASLLIRTMGAADSFSGKRPPLLPSFVIGFLVLAVLNSLGFIPDIIADTAADLSRWALLVAIAAVGMKTSLAKTMAVGGSAIALIVAETVFIGVLVLAGLHFLD